MALRALDARRWRAAAVTQRAAALLERLAPVDGGGGARSHRPGGGGGAPLDAASLERLRAGITGARRGCGPELDRGGKAGAARASSRRARADGARIEESPDAIPLGLLAQQIAGDCDRRRACGRRRWICGCAVIPGRRAEAALALADARRRAGGADPLAARGAFQTAIEAAPGSALFW